MRRKLWKNLLWLSQQIGLAGEAFRFCSFDIDSDDLPEINQFSQHNSTPSKKVIISRDKLQPPHQGLALIRLNSDFKVEVEAQGNLDDEELKSIVNYLPYCFLSLLARQKKRAITIAHFAQSLDGKIATFSGDSKWIGNEDNLKHAHRMRALSDGIMVGSGTLRNDQPRLNVRLVEGSNPTRIVIGSLSETDCACLMKVSSDQVLVIGSKETYTKDNICYTSLPRKDGKINCISILEYLYEQGIHVVYLEGGAVTTSNFLNEKAIDIFQLHISPQIFGSGKQAILLPEIKEVKKAIQFDHFSFEPVGNTMMFVGRLNPINI